MRLHHWKSGRHWRHGHDEHAERGRGDCRERGRDEFAEMPDDGVRAGERGHGGRHRHGFFDGAGRGGRDAGNRVPASRRRSSQVDALLSPSLWIAAMALLRILKTRWTSSSVQARGCSATAVFSVWNT